MTEYRFLSIDRGPIGTTREPVMRITVGKNRRIALIPLNGELLSKMLHQVVALL